MPVVYAVSTPKDIRKYIKAALAHPDRTELLPLANEGDAQKLLDGVFEVLIAPALPSNSRNPLRRLALKLATKYDKFPNSLVLRGVTMVDNERHGEGAFGEVFWGTYERVKVALKFPKMYRMMSDDLKASVKKAFYTESFLWKGLEHEHILPFLGVAEDLLPDLVCMVVPWMENGSLRQYRGSHLETLTHDHGSDSVLLRWMHQIALGLAYLHTEGIIHGDMHAGNILVDETGGIRLADFGLSLLAEGTAYNYGSHHGGGATRWSAPELFDPELFGLETTRPTFLTDVYAFACVCVELYTGNPPFEGINDHQVMLRVVRGERPPRPSLPRGAEISNHVWFLMQSCWSHKLDTRPSAGSITGSLHEMINPTYNPQIQRYLAKLQAEVEHVIRSLTPKPGYTGTIAWIRRAMDRTVDFYTRGPSDTFSWVLVSDKIANSIIPIKFVEIEPPKRLAKGKGTRHHVVSRSCSLNRASTSPGSSLIGLTTTTVSDLSDFAVMKLEQVSSRFAGITMREILIASPHHLKWTSANLSFTLPELDARPVDLSDPFGELELVGGETRMSWIGRSHNTHESMFTFEVSCADRPGSHTPDEYHALVYPVSVRNAGFELLCHAV